MLILCLGAPRVAPARAPEAASVPDQGTLWRDAQAKLETADYVGAIGALTVLYEQVVHDPEADALRTRVRVSLQEAHVRAYGVDGDKEHLVVALDLLDRTLESVPAGDASQLDVLTARRAEVQAVLDAHQEPEPEPEPEPEVVPEAEPEPEAVPEAEPEPEPKPELEPAKDTGRPLIIAGAVLAGVGLIGNGLLIGGLVSANNAVATFETDPGERNGARDDITRGNTIGIVGGAVGGVFTVAGAVLITLGIRKRQTSGVSPMMDAQTMGVQWSGRF